MGAAEGIVRDVFEIQRAKLSEMPLIAPARERYYASGLRIA
jgi:hypothetical protein